VKKVVRLSFASAILARKENLHTKEPLEKKKIKILEQFP